MDLKAWALVVVSCGQIFNLDLCSILSHLRKA